MFFVATYGFKPSLSMIRGSALSQSLAPEKWIAEEQHSEPSCLYLVCSCVNTSGYRGREASRRWVALLKEGTYLSRFWFLTWAHFDFAVIWNSQVVSACWPNS